MDPAACESWLNCDRERYRPVDMGNSNIRPKRLHCFWRVLHASAAYHGAITTFVYRPLEGECSRHRYYGKICMRGCTCIADKPQWCPWCAQLAARAGITFGALAMPPAAPKGKAAPRSRAAVAAHNGMPTRSILAKADRFRSDTERRYAALLDQWKHEGEVKAWWYEVCKGLYLAPALSYTPDFLVQFVDRPFELEWHEVKGPFIREKDWNKAKMAAALYPIWHFVLAQRKDQQWTWQTIPAL